MPQRRLFRVTTPLGYDVVLTRNRWREIIRFKHPVLDGKESLVRGCLQNPDTVHESQKDATVHLYYAAAGKRYVCVVVAPGDGDARFVVTAYFTRKVKKGREIWKS